MKVSVAEAKNTLPKLIKAAYGDGIHDDVPYRRAGDRDCGSQETEAADLANLVAL